MFGLLKASMPREASSSPKLALAVREVSLPLQSVSSVIATSHGRRPTLLMFSSVVALAGAVMIAHSSWTSIVVGMTELWNGQTSIDDPSMKWTIAGFLEWHKSKSTWVLRSVARWHAGRAWVATQASCANSGYSGAAMGR